MLLPTSVLRIVSAQDSKIDPEEFIKPIERAKVLKWNTNTY